MLATLTVYLHIAAQAFAGPALPGDPAAPTALDCAALDCAAAFPGAEDFVAVEGKPYVEALDGAGRRLGWLVLSTTVTDIDGYAGKPLATLVGLDTEGRITGAEVVHHSEPILLLGIPDAALDGFVDSYAGVHATEDVRVGGESADGLSVDAISGATVTVLAENQTILQSARALGADVGVIARDARAEGRFVTDERPWTWDALVDAGAMGHLVVTDAEMGRPDSGAPWLDLWFTIADAPHVGIPLLGRARWEHAMSELADGEHLVVMLNRGQGSFKGSGFVRGGIFDRVRLEQGLRTIVFTDMDYTNLGHVPAEGAPRFREAALFVARDDALDPGADFDLVFLGSQFTLRGGVERDFRNFTATHRLPQSVYRTEGPSPEWRMVRDAWSARPLTTVFVTAWLALLASLFVARRWTAGSMRRLKRVHDAVLVTSFLLLGVWLHVQPSITQLLTILGSLAGAWRWSLFLSDPLIFVTWIFIAVVVVIWGRGVYCGWACPYGAMSELLFRVGRLLRLPELEVRDSVHLRARYARYVILAGLVAVFLWNPETGERLAEVEPFKSTFFVPFWTRPIGLAAWWLVLAGWAMVTYRPFCRYLCPLGAALALPSTVRLAGPRRRDFCSKCRICTRGCESRAFRADGSIDPRECLNCWECEANYYDDEVCPPLVADRRKRERGLRRRVG